MLILENANLQKFNTFGIDCYANHLFHLEEEKDIVEYHRHPLGYRKQQLLLGGGSNILLCSELNGSVARIEWKGITIIDETSNDLIVKVAAGENWHEFVLWALKNDLGGIENLSLIPGQVGTSPIQNIGAYGVEIKDCIKSLRYYRWNTGKIEIIDNNICDFGYRTSIFKTKWVNEGVILSVNFRLTKKNHVLNTSYGPITEELSRMEKLPSISSISKAIVNIRISKLPDPSKLGNSGSFFKNPIIKKSLLLKMQEKNPKIPFHVQKSGKVKLSAGWLIEMSGWKGKRNGDAGMHENQALVLVNYGKASGKDLLEVANLVKKDVLTCFDIKLEHEVNIIGIE